MGVPRQPCDLAGARACGVGSSSFLSAGEVPVGNFVKETTAGLTHNVSQQAHADTALGRVQFGLADSFYGALQVSPEAGAAEIRAAFRRRALQTHPDKPGGSSSAFRRVLDAFETLSDASRRQQYDQQQHRIAQTQWRSSTITECTERPAKTRDPIRYFARRLAELLQRMSPACRRETIARRLSSAQRMALEEHLVEARRRKAKDETNSKLPLVKASDDVAALALREYLDPWESERKTGTGIYQASRLGKITGYYAKVFLQGLGLQGHVRKELAEAVNDHIALIRAAEQIKQAHPSFCTPEGRRTEDAHSDIDELPDVLASAQVFFYCRHFIGHRHLQLNFKTLAEGLSAWEQLQRARGPTLFKGNGVTCAYTPEAALEQWRRLKEAYLNLASGRHSSRAQLESQLQLWEREYLPSRLRRDCKIWRRQKVREADPTPFERGEGDTQCDASLLRCVERLLRCQARRSALCHDRAAACRGQHAASPHLGALKPEESRKRAHPDSLLMCPPPKKTVRVCRLTVLNMAVATG